MANVGRRRPLRAAWKITPPRIAVQRPWPNGASSPRTSSFRTTDGSERKSLVPLDDKQRCERVAAALQGGEAKSDSRSEDHAVTCRVGANPQREEDDQHTFDELLDEPDLQRPEQARPKYQPELEYRGGQCTQHTGEDECGHDAPRR